MPLQLSITKTRPQESRKLPILPRVGFVVDFAGLRLTYKYAPLLEALLATRGLGSLRERLKRAAAALDEIEFPRAPLPDGVRRSPGRPRGPSTHSAAVRKAAARAAATLKQEETSPIE